MALAQMPRSLEIFIHPFSLCLSRLEAADGPGGHAGVAWEGPQWKGRHSLNSCLQSCYVWRVVGAGMAVLGHGRGGTASRTAECGAGPMVSSLRRIFWPKASGTQSLQISQKSQREEGSSEKIKVFIC